MREGFCQEGNDIRSQCERGSYVTRTVQANNLHLHMYECNANAHDLCMCLCLCPLCLVSGIKASPFLLSLCFLLHDRMKQIRQFGPRIWEGGKFDPQKLNN